MRNRIANPSSEAVDEFSPRCGSLLNLSRLVAIGSGSSSSSKLRGSTSPWIINPGTGITEDPEDDEREILEEALTPVKSLTVRSPSKKRVLTSTRLCWVKLFVRLEERSQSYTEGRALSPVSQPLHRERRWQRSRCYRTSR